MFYCFIYIYINIEDELNIGNIKKKKNESFLSIVIYNGEQ